MPTSAAAMNSGLPPSTMSVPRPAMLVEIVTALKPARLRDDLGLALMILRVEHVMLDAGLLELGSATRSDFSIDTVPTSTGCPFSLHSTISSMTASNFSSSVLKIMS